MTNKTKQKHLYDKKHILETLLHTWLNKISLSKQRFRVIDREEDDSRGREGNKSCFVLHRDRLSSVGLTASYDV